jgi:Fe-S-cluster-containing dehydrogenase component
MNTEFELMMKCDMCYDRTSVGKQPMCTTVCPSRALHYGTWEEIEHLRPRSAPHNRFLFGKQEVQTKVYMMVPREAQQEYLDVAAALDDAPQPMQLRILTDSDPMLANLYSSPE